MVKQKTTNLRQARKVHLIGIGGAGMSGLARMLKKLGQEVTGTDNSDSKTIGELKAEGLVVSVGHDTTFVKAKPDMAIYSPAVPDDDPERVEAVRLGIPEYSYPEAVGQISKDFRTIAVAGTHGKTTVTSMIASIFIENRFDPTVLVGAGIPALQGLNTRVGREKGLFILEACEYKHAFLNYHPQAIVLNSIDPDHFDAFPTYESYIEAFKSFIRLLPFDGIIFANLDDEDVHEIIKLEYVRQFPKANIITFSSQHSSAHYYLDPKTRELWHANQSHGTLELAIPGMHNRMNALAAFAVGHHYGVAARDLLKSLVHFKGSARRFEEKGRWHKAVVIDDYGHHPAEVQATLQAARERFPTQKIAVIFQPHQFSRTRELFSEFATSFKDADLVIIPNIFEARDTAEDTKSVSAEKLAEAITKGGTTAYFGDGFENTIALLQKHAAEFEVVLTMGAGNITMLSDQLVANKPA